MSLSCPAADDAAGPSAGGAAGSSKAATAGAGSSKAAEAAAAAAGGAKQAPTPPAAVLPAVAVLSTAVGEGAAAQIPLILPEKLIRNKVCLQFRPAFHVCTICLHIHTCHPAAVVPHICKGHVHMLCTG